MGLKVFAINDCDWWAGEDVESVSSAFAKESGYNTVADCQADGLLDGPRELTDDELDRLQFCYDWPSSDTRKVSFRVRLQELVSASKPMPCFFASTEY